MVLIWKGKGEHRGIGLVEVAWKVCKAVVNNPFEAECRFARRPTRVQRMAGNGDGYFGGQYGSIAVRACTQASLPSFSRRPQGVRLNGQGSVIGSLEGVWAGSESGPTPHQPLVPTEDCTKVG